MAPVKSGTPEKEREREICEGFRRGERWAFEAVAREYFAYLVNFIANLLRDRDRAVDLAQEAFYLACRAHAQLDPARGVGPWLFQIARNLAYKEYGRRKNRNDVSLDEAMEATNLEPESPYADPRRESVDVETQVRLERAIARLKPKYRDVLILRMMQSLPGERVSELLQIPLSTVNTRMHRALRQLRRYAQQEGIQEDEVFS